MDCKEIQDNLSAYMDKELAPAAEESIRGHLEGCKLCSARHTELLKGWQMLDAWEEVAPPEKLRNRILDSVRPRRKAPKLRAMLSVAAAVLLVLGITVFIAGQKGTSIHAPATVRSAVNSSIPDNGSEDEIIANLDILRDNDFLDALDDLVKIDELPLIEEPAGRSKEPERSSLEMVIS